MNDHELVRYSRHLLLDEIGIEGQQRILNARVLVIGAGGLGCPAALYLASAGVGTLVLADHDTVDLTNLQRQVLHTSNRIGQAKVFSAKTALSAINDQIKIIALNQRLSDQTLDNQIAAADVVLDCSDNFPTRYAINQSCYKHSKPLVSGAAIQFKGQLAVFHLHKNQGPCYHCLFPEAEDLNPVRCATMGVFSPLTGIIGTLQATEALKIISGTGQPLNQSLLLYDAKTCEFKTLHIERDPACAICSINHA